MSQRQILVLQALQVAQHFGFAAVAAESGMGQEVAFALAASGNAHGTVGDDLLVQYRH